MFGYVVFFFFKQKTAYVMRMSDGSSDVCSSDLGLASLTAGELGATILKALVERSGIDPERVDDVVFGHGYPSGEAPSIGRWSWLAAGLPQTVPGFQLDRRCGSGLQAIIEAAMM